MAVNRSIQSITVIYSSTYLQLQKGYKLSITFRLFYKKLYKIGNLKLLNIRNIFFFLYMANFFYNLYLEKNYPSKKNIKKYPFLV